MCYLRGIVFKNMNNIVRSKECFKEALQVDVKCYDALDSLVSNNMLTTNEGLCFPVITATTALCLCDLDIAIKLH